MTSTNVSNNDIAAVETIGRNWGHTPALIRSIHVVPFSVEYNVGKGSNITIRSDIYSHSRALVNVDPKDVVSYSKENGNSLEDSVNKVLAHEVLHYLLGHFSAKYNSYDKKILNLAGDLHINHIIDFRAPGYRAANLGLPEGLTTEEYYQILYVKNEEKNKGKNEESGNSKDKKDSEESGQSSASSKSTKSGSKKGESSEQSDEFKDMISEMSSIEYDKDFSVNEPEDLAPNLEVTNIYYTEEEKEKQIEKSVSSYLNKFEKREKEINTTIDVSNFPGLQNVMNQIIDTDRNFDIVAKKRQQSWNKLNNRRKKTGMLIPGFVRATGGSEKKIGLSPVVFVDVSSSTCSKIYRDSEVTLNDLFVAIAKELKEKCNATIVYYNGSLQKVCTSSNVFFGWSAYGSTSISFAVSQYEDLVKAKQCQSIDKVYVITDGEDEFVDLFNKYDCRVWVSRRGTDIAEISEEQARTRKRY